MSSERSISIERAELIELLFEWTPARASLYIDEGALCVEVDNQYLGYLSFDRKRFIPKK